jgi:hypothetical protein
MMSYFDMCSKAQTHISDCRMLEGVGSWMEASHAGQERAEGEGRSAGH